MANNNINELIGSSSKLLKEEIEQIQDEQEQFEKTNSGFIRGYNK